MDRIFPRDLPVGTVAQIKDGNPFKQILLKPAANLESLEDVIVLLSVQPLDLTKSESKDASSAASGSLAETAKKEPAHSSKTAKP
jgi:cell shape-determining protein MreC